jgi:hypothetical protein
VSVAACGLATVSGTTLLGLVDKLVGERYWPPVPSP